MRLRFLCDAEEFCKETYQQINNANDSNEQKENISE